MLTGCVHGRFQPVHLEHEEYIFSALDKCDHLLVGITQYENRSLVKCDIDPHRSDLFSNPLTYDERVRLITSLFEDKGIPSDRYSFSPFPIDNPEIMERYISKDIKCFTTIVEEWNKEKIERLVKLGYEVKILWDRVGLKGMSASNIRALALRKDSLWRKFVSESTAILLDELDFENRLDEIHRRSTEQI